MSWLGSRAAAADARKQAAQVRFADARKQAAQVRFADARVAAQGKPDSLRRQWQLHRARRELYRSQGYGGGLFRRREEPLYSFCPGCKRPIYRNLRYTAMGQPVHEGCVKRVEAQEQALYRRGQRLVTGRNAPPPPPPPSPRLDQLDLYAPQGDLFEGHSRRRRVRTSVRGQARLRHAAAPHRHVHGRG